MSGRTVAVVGATGAVGRDLLTLLEQRELPFERLVVAASPRSAGRQLDFRGEQVTVRALDDDDLFDGVDVALFSAGGGASREHAPRAAGAGAVVVDNSSAWRMDRDVPLVVTEVNPDALDLLEAGGRGIVANPNCTTMVAMLPLKALHDAFGLTEMVVTSYQAAGGAGQKGIDELSAQVAPLAADVDLLRTDGAAAAKLVEPRVHAAALAFNVVPWLGSQVAGGYTDEELKLRDESRKILGLPALRVTPTCVRVPVVAGHAAAVRATFADPVNLSVARERLEAFPGLLLDEVPTPLAYAGRDEVAVGRLRADLEDPRSLSFFVVGDNLRKGAALNTVQIAELLVERGLV